MTDIQRIHKRQEDKTVVTFSDGYSAVIEEYDDAIGGRVTAGSKYVTEQRHREIEERLKMRVDV